MDSIDYSICEQEPIHIPGFIQPHGLALSYSYTDRNITGISTNFPNAQQLLGTSLDDLFSSSFIDRIVQSELSNHTLIHTQIIDFLGDRLYDFIQSPSGNERIIELIDTAKVNPFDLSRFPLGNITERILKPLTILGMCDAMASEIRSISGYDRVMMYQFDPDYNGAVIAESKNEDVSSYLGLNYPASDIPAQARELYRKKLLRSIVDIDYTPVDFLRLGEHDPLDMTYSHLRSVSPVHIEYLRNMGVQSTMTLSILIDGKLWGLIACHHRQHYQLSLNHLEFIENLGKIFSSLLKTRIDAEAQNQRVRLHSTLETIVSGLRNDAGRFSLINLLANNTRQFRFLFPSDGFALYIGETLLSDDDSLSEKLKRLILTIVPSMNRKRFSTSKLSTLFPNLADDLLTECSGVIAFEVTMAIPTYWIWFRREKAKTLTWSGNPYEKATLNVQGGISPRKSFAAFKETVRYQSDPWSEEEENFSTHFTSTLEDFFAGFESTTKLVMQQQIIRRLEDEKIEHHKQLLESLVDLIEQRDAYTAGHTRRVALYSDLIAKELNISEIERSKLYEASILHDIGKVVVPDSILLKPGRLNSHEYDLIKSHLETGYQLLQRIDYYRPLAEIIRYHHEKYDGSGYPSGMKGESVPLLSHIMIVADAIDAMTTNRIYQPRRSMEEALKEVEAYNGIWYHPEVVEAALRALQTHEGDSLSHQIPLTPLEKARFSYYFKDQLTDTYNEMYLKTVLFGNSEHEADPYYIFIEIKGMSLFNQNNGWHAGDNLIQSIARSISEQTNSKQFFRIFGDDFILGCGSIAEGEEWAHHHTFTQSEIQLKYSIISKDQIQKKLMDE